MAAKLWLTLVNFFKELYASIRCFPWIYWIMQRFRGLLRTKLLNGFRPSWKKSLFSAQTPAAHQGRGRLYWSSGMAFLAIWSEWEGQVAWKECSVRKKRLSPCLSFRRGNERYAYLVFFPKVKGMGFKRSFLKSGFIPRKDTLPSLLDIA